MKFCKVYKFADDPNLLHFNSSIKKLNRLVNVGMKQDLSKSAEDRINDL